MNLNIQYTNKLKNTNDEILEKRLFVQILKRSQKKKQNLSNKDVEEIKRLNNLTTHGIKKLAKIKGIKNYDDQKEKILFMYY